MVFRPEAGGPSPRAGRQPCGAAAGARPRPHRTDSAGGARAGLRGAAGLPGDRARLGRAPHRSRRHLGAPRRRERPALHQARQARARNHDPHPVGARGGALRLPGCGGRAAGRSRGLLRPGRRQPAGGPLPQPAPGGSRERSARLAAGVGRVPALRPAGAAGAAQAARARQGHAAGGGAQGTRVRRGAGRHRRLAPQPGQGRSARLRLPDRPAPRLRARSAPAARDQRRARRREAEEARARSGAERRPARLRRGRWARDRDVDGGAPRQGRGGGRSGRARGARAQHGARHARAGRERQAAVARRARGALRGLVRRARRAARGARRHALRGARALAFDRARRGPAAGGSHPGHRAHGRLLRPPRARGRPGARDRPRRLLAPAGRPAGGGGASGGGRRRAAGRARSRRS